MNGKCNCHKCHESHRPNDADKEANIKLQINAIAVVVAIYEATPFRWNLLPQYLAERGVFL